MRILIGANVPRNPNSGASGTVFQTIQSLRDLGHEVDEIWEDDITRRIRHGNLHYLLELPRSYRDTIRERCLAKSYELILLSQPHAYLAAKDHIRAKRRGIFLIRSHGVEQKVHRVLAIHNAIPGKSSTRTFLSNAMSFLLDRHAVLSGRYADGIIVACTDDKAFLVDHLKVEPEKIAVIPSAAPEKFVKQPPQPMTEARLRKLLYVGQFAPFKAPNILAAALNLILPRCGDITMSWICDQKHHSSVRNLLDPNIVNRVNLLDWRTQNDLIENFDEHGIFLFPSYTEGFGKACYEAMARGLCVVATNTGGMRDYIQDGISGRLVEVGDPHSLATAVMQLLANYDECWHMAEEARAQAIQYSWNKSAQRTIEFYRTLLSAKEKC